MSRDLFGALFNRNETTVAFVYGDKHPPILDNIENNLRKKSALLCEETFWLAQNCLKPRGSFHLLNTVFAIMADPSDRVFIPFNFSAVLPFDALASAMNQLPTLQPVEPSGFFSADPDEMVREPSIDEQSEMSRLIATTVQDEYVMSDYSLFLSPSVVEILNKLDIWVSYSFLQAYSVSLNKTFVSQIYDSNCFPNLYFRFFRFTFESASYRNTHENFARSIYFLFLKILRDREWKRIICHDFEQAVNLKSSDNQTHSWVPPVCNQLSSAIQQSFKHPNSMDSPVKRNTPKRPRPQNTTPPSFRNTRSSTGGNRSQHSPESTAPRIRSTPRTAHLSHVQELKRHEDAKVVDSENFHTFLNVLRSFVRRPDDLMRSDHEIVDKPFLLATANPSDIREVYQSICLVSDQDAIGLAPPELLSQVIAILRTRVQECCRQIQSGNEADSYCISIPNIFLGILAASTILSILSAPRSPRVLLVQELLEDLINMLYAILTSVIFPMSDPLYKKAAASNRRKTGTRIVRNERIISGEHMDTDDDDSSHSDSDFKEKRSHCSHRPFPKKDEALHNQLYLFLDGLTRLFQKENHLPDEIVDRCTKMCVQSLSVTGIVRLQSHAIKLVAMIFFRYPARRVYILDEVQEAVKVIPPMRKHLRTYHLPEDNCAVRPSSALLCLLLTIAGNDTEDGQNRAHHGVDPDDGIEFWCKLRLKRHNCAVKLTVHVLEPIFDKVCSDRDAELRAAFQTFFEDLLTLYGRPEWPSAELMLQTLSVSIITKLRGSGDKSVYARVIAIETLGAVASKMCDLHGSFLLRENNVSMQVGTEKMETERMKLLSFLSVKKSLQMDSAYAFLEAMFFSDDHNSALNFNKRVAKNNNSKESATEMDEDHEELNGDNESQIKEEDQLVVVQRNALVRLECISSQKLRGDDVPRSEAVHALRFVGAHRNFAGGFKTIVGSICDGMHDPAPTIRAKSIKALSAIDSSCHGLLRVFPNVLPFIEASCRDISILARDAALELLSRSLTPASSSTWEYASKLEKVAHDHNNVVQDTVLFDSIFEIVMKRMCDTATSVRKRAIAICRSVLSEALKHLSNVQITPVKSIEPCNDATVYENRIIRICTGLVHRLDDPELSVRDLSERVLRFGLFNFDPSSAAAWSNNEEAEGAPQMANRLTSVYVKLPSNIHMTFMSRILHKAMLIKQKPLLMSIVGRCVEQLHTYEAQISKLTAGSDTKSLSVSDLELLRTLSLRRVGCSSVICAFGSLDTTLIEPHCRSLAPSIKGVVDGSMSETDLLTVQRILNVLEIGLGRCDNVDSFLIDEVIHDVELIVCQSPMSILEDASVRCLCVVANKTEAQKLDNVVERSARAFKDYLDSQTGQMVEIYKEQDERRIIAFERHARCAVVRLGLLARHGSLNDEFIESVFDTLATVCLTARSADTRGVLSKAGVRALSHFLIRHRSFLQKGTEILVSLIKSKQCAYQDKENISLDAIGKNVVNGIRRGENSAVIGVKLCILQGFHELLRDEEDRNTTKKGAIKSEETNEASKIDGRTENQGKGGSDKIEPDTRHNCSIQNQPMLAAEEDAEAGFLALSAQAMFPHVKECATSSSIAIRRTVANIVGLLVRQGLLLPANVVPCLFGLLLDQDARCREYAMRVIAFIADRHSGMLTSAALPALRVCFQNAYDASYSCRQSEMTRRGTMDYGSMTFEKMCMVCIDSKSGQSLLSGALMSLRREQRRGVLESIMREFDPRVIVHNTVGEDTRVGDKAQNDGELEDVDDDVGITDGTLLDLSECKSSGNGRCTLATLHFLAVTLACLDYTDGAGVGGSLTLGGGTAAAESRMKVAREDVMDLIGIATRIISNSGQAILRVAKQVCRTNCDAEKKKRVAGLAARINLLLRLKHHLKIERWKNIANGDDDREEEEIIGNSRTPEFHPDMEMLNVIGWGNVELQELSEDLIERVFEGLFKLMREDAIDEADLSTPSRRGKGGRGRIGGNTGRARNTSMSKSGNRASRRSGSAIDVDTPVRGSDRVLRRATRASSKRKQYYEESEESDSVR